MLAVPVNHSTCHVSEHRFLRLLAQLRTLHIALANSLRPFDQVLFDQVRVTLVATILVNILVACKILVGYGACIGVFEENCKVSFVCLLRVLDLGR